MAISPMNKRSTACSAIRRFSALPHMPPRMPPPVITIRSVTGNSGMFPVTSEERILADWEKKMIYKEHCAASFVDME